jgi:effector-binding domain-containing protein
MIYLLLPPLLIIAAILVYLARLPADFQVRRSLYMNLDRARVFAQVRDLRRWRDWSPWLIHDPDARLEYSPDPQQEGGYYAWNGRAIGTGRLTQCRLDEPACIEQRIDFRRPFKLTAEVLWEFAPAGDGTEVTWEMRGRMPLLWRFMTGLMTRMLAQDFTLGLAQLRGTLDPHAERPHIRFVGPVEQPAQTALTIPFSGDVQAMLAAMQAGYARLAAHVQAQGTEPAGPACTIYHRVDAQGTHFTCDLALPVAEGTDPGPFSLKRIGGGRYYATELMGSYEFLGPLWYSIMAHLRMHRIRQDRTRSSLEVYVIDPSRVSDSNALLTRILVPVR